MAENVRYSECLLEHLYRVYGDVAGIGRPIDFLSRALSLPENYLRDLAAKLISQGYIRETLSDGRLGYVLTPMGCSYFAQRFLEIPSSLIERTLSGTAIVAIVDHAYERLRRQELKAVLREAFRTVEHPVFARATERRLYDLLQDYNAPKRCAYIFRFARELLHPGRFSGERVSHFERDSLRRVLQEEGVLATLEGRNDDRRDGRVLEPMIASEQLTALKKRLLHLSALQPNKRGFAFEAFLTDLFQLFGLEPRKSFRLHGEQIDGSFTVSTETYLMEAKWHEPPIGQAPLLVFKGKVESKAAWSRGLFISYSGFTLEGIEAFSRGRATNIIGMSGQDLFLILEGRILLIDAILKKARRAAETGEFYVPVPDLLTL